MELIAKIPCSFGGKKFFIGDTIPEEMVLDPKAQEKRGVLVRVDAQGQPQSVPQPEGEKNIPILVQVDEGELSLEITQEGMQAIFSVLTGKADVAEPVIGQMTDGDALMLLHMAESRKAVRAAVEARAKAIAEAGEQ